VYGLSTATTTAGLLARSRVTCLALLTLLTLGGCASLPTSGPTALAIERGRHGGPLGEVELRDVTAPPAAAAEQAAALPTGGLTPLAQTGVVDAVGPGDVLDVRVFEVGASLFGGGGSAYLAQSGISEPSAAGTIVGPVTVDRSGAIDLPYAGRMQVAGHTPSEIGAMIAGALSRKSQAPQVIVGVRENVANTVTVMGDVKKSGRIPLTLARERVLDAIAEAGGAAHANQDMVVRVTRGERSAEVRMDRLLAGSGEDLALLPGDRIELFTRPRTLTVFGAAGKVSEVAFETPKVTLAEALARAGGPLDQTADASAIYVFRYDRSDDSGAPQPGARPVIYRLNLLQVDSYFAAQTFEMRPKDVVLVANAAANQPTKLIQVLNLFFSPFYTAKVLTH
jgi:polysaccharide export outer membrane protein